MHIMSHNLSEELSEWLWMRAIVGTTIGIIIGTLNRGIVTTLFAHSIPARLFGFVIGGIVAGAIQGMFLGHYRYLTLAWIGMSSLGWLVIGLPEIWLPA